MSEFLYVYRGGMNASTPPEARQQQIQRWMAWFKDLTAKGHVKNMGNPLERTGKTIKGSDKTVTDGPFAEAKDLVGGYSLIEAKDLDQATELAKGCPIFLMGGSVEIRPIMLMNM
jgi:hypothetical protein